MMANPAMAGCFQDRFQLDALRRRTCYPLSETRPSTARTVRHVQITKDVIDCLVSPSMHRVDIPAVTPRPPALGVIRAPAMGATPGQDQ